MKKWLIILTCMVAGIGCIYDIQPAIIESGNLECGYEGGLFTVPVIMDRGCKVVSDQSWCIVSSDSDSKLIVNVAANDSFEDRSATIIMFTKRAREEMHILQKSAPLLVIRSDNEEVPGKGGLITINVESNIEYSATALQDWIDEIQSAGKHTYSIQQNSLNEDRTGAIEFSAKDGSVDTVFRFVQKANSTLIIPNTLYELSSDAARVEVEVQTNLNPDIIISEDWICALDNTANPEHLFTFLVEKNDLGEERVGKITFIDHETKMEGYVVIRQQAAAYMVIYEDYIQLDAQQCVFSVGIYTNIEYTVSCNKAWINLETSYKTDNHSRVFSVLSNDGFTARSAKIVITPVAGGIGSKEIVVRQAGRPASISIRHHADIFAAPLLSGDTKQCLVDWGDGIQEPYSDFLSHQYEKKEAGYTVVLKTGNAEGLTIRDLADIEILDFSNLLPEKTTTNQ
ncbi:MAG: BACON domain-containing protein [Bacteroidales bacterium]|nr:BACON domain-containing protein [Bacteroidales bacterium]